MATSALNPGEILIDLPESGVRVAGRLEVPRGAEGIVLFVHGHGSSRLSLRNQSVARHLRMRGLATLLFDLLTEAESRADDGPRALRLDIRMLVGRLKEVTTWAVRQPELAGLPLGFFGASTGAAAALAAAAELPQHVKAVVARGGRPDLAGPGHLALVEAPTLLIVGAEDRAVLMLNEEAMARMQACNAELEVVAGASHLFEEEGKLAVAADLARAWFERYLIGRSVPRPRARSLEADRGSLSGDRL